MPIKVEVLRLTGQRSRGDHRGHRDARRRRVDHEMSRFDVVRDPLVRDDEAQARSVWC